MHPIFNHRVVRFAFLSILLLAFIASYFVKVSFVFFILPIIVFGSIIAYGSARIDSQFFVSAICSKDTQEKKVALSFDDGPDPLVTPQVLALLREYQAPSIFFCIGRKIAGNEPLLQQIHEEGHIIGNHSFSHSYFLDFFPKRKLIKEFEKTDELIEESIGHRPRFFRPPYGVTNPPISRAVKERGYTVIGWDVRSLDTVIKEEEKVIDRVIQGVKPGSIILFHDINQSLLSILPAVLDYLQSNNYKITRLDELIGKEAYVNG